MKALPSHRNDILMGMAAFTGRLSEDHPEVCLLGMQPSKRVLLLLVMPRNKGLYWCCLTIYKCLL